MTEALSLRTGVLPDTRLPLDAKGTFSVHTNDIWRIIELNVRDIGDGELVEPVAPNPLENGLDDGLVGPINLQRPDEAASTPLRSSDPTAQITPRQDSGPYAGITGAIEPPVWKRDINGSYRLRRL